MENDHQGRERNASFGENSLNSTARSDSTSSANLSASVPAAASTNLPSFSEGERRASIQTIMRDTKLTETQRRKSIQSLMDGRRRSSLVNFQKCRASSSMAASAKIVQDQFSDSDDEWKDVSNSDSQIASSLATDVQRQMLKRAHLDYKRGESSSSSSYLNASALNIEQMNLSGTPPGARKHIAYDLEGNSAGDPQKLEESRPECNHYDRKCSTISPCCGMVFGCRLCHDDCDQLNIPIYRTDDTGDKSEHIPRKIKVASGSIPKFSKRGSMSSIMSCISEMGDDVHHNIDRFVVEEIICRVCFARQSSKTNHCVKCKVQFGEYHCDICNLWMSAQENPYHCKDCGFCRVGGQDMFRHCDGCGMCIDVEVFHDHNCQSGKYMANCPVCYEDLFSSRNLTHEMPCGHNIHWHCFNTLANHDSRCPICKKTAHEDMSAAWASLARDVAAQPLPPDQTRCVDISCNDCEVREKNRRWHYLGVQCKNCGGFNTTHNIKMTGLEAHKYLHTLEAERNESRSAREHD